MAEQALIADLRIGLSKFDADLRRAMQAADKASADIAKAFDRVDTAVKSIPSEVAKLNNSLKETEQATNRAAQATERQTQVMGRFKGILGSLGLLVTAQQMVQFTVSTIKSAEALSSIERQFELLTGSQKAARAEMAFIRAETDRLALSTLEGAKGYARLANAAAGTKLAGEGARQVFMGLNTITRALSLSNDEYGRVLNQVTQIIAKGKIQTEELMTLAESGIPVYTMLAKSMGISGEALSDMLQKGKVSSQALILLVDDIQKKYGELARQASQTLPAQISRGWNKILLEVTDVAQGILRSGELINAFKFESNILDIFPDREVITAQVDYIIRQFTAISLIVEGAFEHTLNAIKKIFADVVSSLQKFLTPIGDFFKNLPGASWVAEQFQALVGGLTEADKTVVQAQKSTEKFKGLFFEIFGTEGQTAVQRWDNFVKDALSSFGKEMPPLIDSEKMVSEADKANSELLKLQEQAKKDIESLQEEARQEKRHRDVATEEEAMKEIASMRRRLDDEAYRDQERLRQQLIAAAKDAAKAIEEIRSKLAEDTRDEQDKIHQDFLRILDRANKERIAIDQQPIEDFNKTIENMKKDIQRSLGNTISDAIRGDLSNIKDAADLIKELFADVSADIASRLIAAFAIDPIINQLKPLLAKVKGLFTGQGGGQQTTGGNIIGAIGGIGAGVGVGMGVSNLAGGGRGGGALGGIAGGAVAGGTIGTIIAGPGFGTAVGAALGAVVGGIMGGLMGGGKSKETIATQTTPGFPSSQEGSAFGRSPFGILTMFDQAKLSDEAANAAILAISEIDSGIARVLNNHQEEVVKQYFQTAKFEGSVVRDEEMNDAVAKAVQLRFYHALTALAGEDTAKSVVGEAFSATAGTIQAIQSRAMEALEILATIADFKAGDLSQTAQQIKAINDQFEELKNRATVLGLPTEDIVAEQQKQLAKITTDFNEGIADAILGITDPIKLEFVQLERMQEERRQNAIDAGADLVEVDRLSQLEREELEKKHQQNLTDIAKQSEKDREAATANIFQAIYAIEDPFKATMLSIQAQVAAFQAQVEAGLIPQSLVDRFETSATSQAVEQERARMEAEAALVEEFNQSIHDQLATLGDDYAREMLEMDRMHEERYRKAIEMGADLNAVAQLNHREREQAEREHQDRLNQIQAEKQRQGEDAIDNLFLKIWEIEDPFRAVLLGIEIEAKQLMELVKELGIPPTLVERYITDRREQAQRDHEAALAREAKAIDDFNFDIQNSILAMTNANAAELAEMDRMHQERIDQAIALGADLAAVERLNQMEREQLLQEHEDRRKEIEEQGYRDSQAASSNIIQQILGVENTWMASIFAIQQQLAIFQEQVEKGWISQDLVNVWLEGAYAAADQAEADRQQREADARRREAEAAAAQRQREAEQRRREAEQRAAQRQREAEQRKREAEQRKREAEQRKREREQEAERRRRAKLQFDTALANFTDPMEASMLQLNEQVREFRQMTKDGIVPKYAVDMFKRLSIAALEIDQALQAISGGGGGTPIEQVADSFATFIRAGNPLSETAQQMQTLQDSFAGLMQAADMLGLSTEALEWSYEQQARVIRDQAIDAINKEMDAKKDQLKQIDEFLASMRLDDVLPGTMRFDEARIQFAEALQTGDVSKAVSASEQYLGIAQQQFGTTAQYFSAREEVGRLLTNLKEQQERNVETEREQLLMREERELEQVRIGRSSLDYLKRISSDNSDTSRGIEQLIGIALSQRSDTEQTRQLLLRLAAKIKA